MDIEIIELYKSIFRYAEVFYEKFREFWLNSKSEIAIFLLSILAARYGYFVIQNERWQWWRDYETIKSVIENISQFLPIGAIIVGLVMLGVDIMMWLSDRSWKKRKKLREKMRDDIEHEFSEKILDWNKRRIEAESQGYTFTEPMPISDKSSDKGAKLNSF